jgi:hypothetical protein
MRCISIVRSLYFTVISVFFLNHIISPAYPLHINVRVPFSLSRITMSGLLLRMAVASHFLIPESCYPTFTTCYY